MHPHHFLATCGPAGHQARRWPLLLASALLALAGCAAVGPNHQAPLASVGPRWSGPLPHGGSLGGLGDGWRRFNDPVLLQLQQEAERDSPSLAIAWAKVEAARATLRSAGAGATPSVSGGATVSRTKPQGTGASTTRTVSADAAWELDLFGKARRGVESAQAQVDARRTDWHDARVTLAAEVASDYVQYRACGLLIQTYEQELVSIDRTTQATESLVRAGLSAATDAALAQATRASTTAALIAQRAQCELLVTSLSNLTGLQDAALRAALAPNTAPDGPAASAAIPVAPRLAVHRVPAEALRQRPDVASRERDLAAASANVGVKMADLYPSIQLAGAIGLAAGGGASSGTWSFGPSISIPLLDGGARQAAVAAARASHEQAYAQWRATVRDAVTEVEQALVRLADASQRVAQVEQAAQAYRRYLTGAEAERRAGTISLLSFEEARRLALATQLDLIGLQRDQVTDWIALYKALGGGWDADSSTDITPPHSRIARQTAP